MNDTSASVGSARPVWAHRLTRGVLAPSPPTNVHAFTAFAFFTGGRAVMHQETRFEVRPGDVYLVPAGAPHGIVSATEPEAWGVSFRSSWFTPSELAALLTPFERAASGASKVISIPGDRQEHLARLCAELRAETTRRSDNALDELVNKNLLALILAEVTRADPRAPQAGARPDLVGGALRFIERHCLRPISLADIAASLGRSPSHVSAAVRRATGRTVTEWIVAGRLAEARGRLLHTDEKIETIAERVGYSDVTHFIRMFRREHGVTPTAWRLRAREGEGPPTSRA